jgi:hypothetical protein
VTIQGAAKVVATEKRAHLENVTAAHRLNLTTEAGTTDRTWTDAGAILASTRRRVRRATTGTGARVPRTTAMNLANWTVAVDHAASVRLLSGTGVVATNWAQMTNHTAEPIPQDRIDLTVDEKIGVESATEAINPM